MDYSVTMYLRIKSLMYLKKQKIAAIDAERILDKANLSETHMERIRLLVAINSFNEERYETANTQFNKLRGTKALSTTKALTTAIIAATQVDDFTGALDYFRVEGSKVRTSSFSILYELASEQNKVDALNEIANQYAAEYGVSKEQAHSKMLNLIRAKANLTRIKNRL